MAYFDQKQKELIQSWRRIAEEANNDYIQFMANWIAFNAICYQLYHQKAVNEVAYIDRRKSKLDIVEKKLSQHNQIIAQSAKLESAEEKWKLDIQFPERFFLTIKKSFTENRIYQLFIDNYQDIFLDLPDLKKHFNTLKNSLKKGDYSFVINMARLAEYKYPNSPEILDQMSARGIIVTCEKNRLKTVVDCLYQIRCNIFHGEKIPGEINDDRIVKSANPVLTFIVTHLANEHKITE